MDCYGLYWCKLVDCNGLNSCKVVQSGANWWIIGKDEKQPTAASYSLSFSRSFAEGLTIELFAKDFDLLMISFGDICQGF